MYAESEEAKMKKITACLCIMAVTMFFAFFLFYPWSRRLTRMEERPYIPALHMN